MEAQHGHCDFWLGFQSLECGSSQSKKVKKVSLSCFSSHKGKKEMYFSHQLTN